MKAKEIKPGIYWVGGVDWDLRNFHGYLTQRGSTRRLAYCLLESLEGEGIPVRMKNLKSNHISDVMTDVLNSKAVLVGSPTLNNGMLPTVGAFLTYLKGLRPKNKIGFAFGSYEWGGQAVKEIENVMGQLNWELPVSALNFKWIPDEKEFETTREMGTQLAKALREG